MSQDPLVIFRVEFHEQNDCPHPEFHPETPNLQNIAILRDWLLKNGDRSNPWGSKRLLRVAPLCEFGGVSWKTGGGTGDTEEAGGTWAVCPKCNAIEMCGFVDGTKIQPEECADCETPLSFADYFQGIYKKSGPGGEEVAR